MAAAPDPSAASSAFDILYYVGGAAAAFILGMAGYRRGRAPEPAQLATVAGAIVDNQALAPLLQRFDALIARLDALITRADKLLEASEKEAEEEAQQERVDRAVKAAMDELMRVMRENPAAEMPGIRR